MRFLERILHDTLSLFVAKASERPAKAAPSPPPMDPQAASSTLQPESAPHCPPEQPCTAPPTPTSAMHKIAKRRPFRLYFSGPEGLDPTLKHVALFMMLRPGSLPEHGNLTALTIYHPNQPDAITHHPGTIQQRLGVSLYALRALRQVNLVLVTAIIREPRAFRFAIRGTFQIRTFESGAKDKLCVITYRSEHRHTPLGPHDIPTYPWEVPTRREDGERWKADQFLEEGQSSCYLASFESGPIPLVLLRRCLERGTRSVGAHTKRAPGSEAPTDLRGTGKVEEQSPTPLEGRGERLPVEMWDQLWEWHLEKRREAREALDG